MLFNTIRRDEGIEPFIEIVNEAKSKHLEQFEKSNRVIFYSFLQCLYPDQLADTIESDQTNATTRNNEKLSCVG